MKDEQTESNFSSESLVELDRKSNFEEMVMATYSCELS
uniref:Uncharacterized protein n=1 Tax=Zea mays TaxID=4577 RepID=B6UFB6_MAIZE|nr:hypothetical protein [Zea mays]